MLFYGLKPDRANSPKLETVIVETDFTVSVVFDIRTYSAPFLLFRRHIIKNSPSCLRADFSEKRLYRFPQFNFRRLYTIVKKLKDVSDSY